MVELWFPSVAVEGVLHPPEDCRPCINLMDWSDGMSVERALTIAILVILLVWLASRVL